MKNYRWAAGIVAMLLFIVWIGAGCKKEPGNETWPISQVSALDMPTYVAANQDSFYLFRVVAPEGLFFDSVVCRVSSLHATLPDAFALYDDGGFDSLWGPVWASRYSGDVVPHNGTFTRHVSVRQILDELFVDSLSSINGNYSFEFTPFNGSTPGTGTTYMVSAQNVETSRILSFPKDSIFTECFTPIPMTVHVSHSEADAVSSVQLELIQNNAADPLVLADFQPSSGDTIWQLSFAPTTFGCTQTDMTGALYHLIYRVQTRFGMGTEQAVHVHSFINSRPIVSNSLLPDTLYRPASLSDTNRIVMTMRLQDCEYLAARDFDSYSVHYDVSRDDLLHWGSSPAFALFDNNAAPDGRPFDGTWAGGLSVTKNESLPNNLYYFRFYAIDCAQPHDTSAYLLDSVRVIQATAMMKSAPWRAESARGFATLP